MAGIFLCFPFAERHRFCIGYLCNAMSSYQLSFKKFISSQHLSTGINVTVAVLVPGIILYQYDLLSIAIGIPIGAMFVALSDSAGPPQHRTNGLIAAILLNSCMVLIAGFSYRVPWLAGIEIAVFGIVFSMAAVFGNRANNIGVMALIAFILGGAHTMQDPWQQALFYFTGGAWYGLFSLTSYKLRPYRLVEQLVGESLIHINSYLLTKGELYSKNVKYDAVYEKLLQQQIAIHKLQEDIRELMFKTRAFVKESTDKSRRLMMIFLDSIDFFEQVMTSQQDYNRLHKDFDDTAILDQYHFNIKTIAHTLELMGIALQSSQYGKGNYHYQQELAKSKALFSEIRKEHLKASTVEAFIRLRHVLYNLEKLTERLDRIVLYLDTREKLKQKVNISTQPFINHQQFNFRMFFSNLTIRSVHFRHALRVTVALLCGYIISLYFPLGHGYWILLTIASIMKPSFGTSKQRNFQRIMGTVTGSLAGFTFLYITQNHTAIFIAMLIGMATAYTFLRLQYFISSTFITFYVLLGFYFLQGTLAGVFHDRVIDTVIGGVLSLLSAYLILPSWEYSTIRDVVAEAIRSGREYFIKASGYFTGSPPTELAYKVARKGAFVALSNLSEALQRMISDPKSRQHALEDYHQFTVTHHILISYIASVSYYAGQFGRTADTKDFTAMSATITRQFDQLLLLSEGDSDTVIEGLSFPFNKRVEKLLAQRKQQLTEGTETIDIRRTLSELKSITDQYQLIHAVLNDEVKILRRI